MWLMTNTPASDCPGGEARYDRGFVKTGQVTPDLYGQSHLIRLLTWCIASPFAGAKSVQRLSRPTQPILRNLTVQL